MRIFLLRLGFLWLCGHRGGLEPRGLGQNPSCRPQGLSFSRRFKGVFFAKFGQGLRTRTRLSPLAPVRCSQRFFFCWDFCKLRVLFQQGRGRVLFLLAQPPQTPSLHLLLFAALDVFLLGFLQVTRFVPEGER
jgi:hypothetical protein